MAKPPAGAPWAPVEYDRIIAMAVKAMERGDATPEQAQIGLRWILYRACRVNDMSFHPDNDRWTSFAEGMRHVGNQIRKMIGLDMSVFDTSGNPREQPKDK